jgi:hypothetical protein
MDFNELAELNVSYCLNTTLQFKNISDYQLMPDRPVALDKSFDILAINALMFNSLAESNYVTLQNMLGIDLNFYGYTSYMHTYFDYTIHYTIVDSTFDFYLNNKIISECNHTAFANMGNSVFGPIVNLNLLEFVKFGGRISPLAFNNSVLNTFAVSVIDHFVFKTRFKFCDYTEIDDDTMMHRIDSDIQEFKISGYNYKLDKSVLPQSVFKLIKTLDLFSGLRSIQTDLFFSSFYYLETVNIYSRNFKQFFHHVGVDWTQSFYSEMNSSYLYQTNVTYINLKQVHSTQLNSFYQFPDTDFCIFTEFPVLRPVVLSYDTAVNNCSCLFFWLVQNFQSDSQIMSQEQIDLSNKNYLNCDMKGEAFANQCLNSSARMLEICNSLNRPEILQQLSSESDLSDYDIEYSLYIVQFVFNVILLPLFCIIGFFSNAFTVRVVRAQAKELKEPFFDYMKLNSWFNCIYCAVYLTTLMNECILINGIYCSSIRKSLFAQWYKILVVEFFGEVIKMCSNVTFIIMNVNRYMLIGRDHHKTLKSISEAPPTSIAIFIFLFSITSSIVNAFQYQINYFNELFDFPTVSSFEDYEALGSIIFSIIYTVHEFIISVLFCLLNLAIEVIIVKKLRKELKEKNDRMSSMTLHSGSVTGMNLEARQRRRKKQNESSKVEQKAILMTCISCVLNFSLRLPETLVPVIYLYQSYDRSNRMVLYFCSELALCSRFLRFCKIFFVLSLNVNYFINYYFNKKFKEAVYVTLPVWVSRHLTLPRDSTIKTSI